MLEGGCDKRGSAGAPPPADSLIPAGARVTFWDSLYRPCNSAEEYCGKYGQPYTKAEYEAQQSWEKILFGPWPFGIFASLFLSVELLKKR